MRESDALFVIGVSCAIVLLAWLVVTIVVRRVPAPTSAERERLEAFFDRSFSSCSTSWSPR